MPAPQTIQQYSSTQALQDAFNQIQQQTAVNYAELVNTYSTIQQAYSQTVQQNNYVAPVYQPPKPTPAQPIGVSPLSPAELANYVAQTQRDYEQYLKYQSAPIYNSYGQTSQTLSQSSSGGLDLTSILNQLVQASTNQVNNVINTANQAIQVVQSEFNRDLNSNNDNLTYLVSRLTNSIDQLIREDRVNLNSILNEVQEFSRPDITNNQIELDEIIRTLEENNNDELDRNFRELSEFNRDLADNLAQSIEEQQSSIERLLEEIGQDQPQFPTDFNLKLNPDTEENLNKALGSFETFTASSKNIIDDIIAIFAPISGIKIPGIGSIGEQISDSINKQLKIFQDIILKIKKGEYKSWDEFYTDYTKNTSLPEAVTAAQNIFAIFELTLYFLRMFGRPLIEGLQQLQADDSRLTLLNYEEAIRAYYREWYSEEQVNTELAKQGFSDNRIQALWEITKPLLTSPDLLRGFYKKSVDFEYLMTELGKQGYTEEQVKILLDGTVNELDETTLNTAYNRGEITKEQYYSTLRKLAYDDTDIEVIDSLRSIIPPLQDLIQMAVKDAFDPKVVSDFGLAEQYPEEVEKWAKKQGLSEEWMLKYWISHWRYPSVEMGYDMLHRRIIGEDRLKLLMKALDIAPRWRDELIKLSYHPLTRVDVRRMYGSGVLNYNEVFEAYLDLGYDQKNARRLADFTVKYETENDTDDLSNIKRRVRTAVENAYLRGTVDRSRAVALLTNLGYSSEIANQTLSLVDLQRSLDGQKNTVDKDNLRAQTLIKNAYKRGTLPRQQAFFHLLNLGFPQNEIESDLDVIEVERSVEFKSNYAEVQIRLFADNVITDTEFRNNLIGYGYTTGEIDLLWGKAQIEDMKKYKKPTEAKLKKWYDLGIIDKPTYIYELTGLGYNTKYVNWIIQEETAQEVQ